MSSALRPPSLGPIVGHTTDTSARVWMRGNESDDSRTVGIAALYLNGKYVKQSARYFRLKREYDRTGLADFIDIKADTPYLVRMGSLSLDTADPHDATPDEEVFGLLPPAESWLKQLESLPLDTAAANFRTFPGGEVDKLSFIFGSCRYPGLLWTKKRADAIFGSILKRFNAPGDGTQPRFFMMVGDQIYADTLPKDLGIGVADTEAEFRERYMSAFGAANTRKLLQSVPTYMILDDHEIEDNWVQGRIRRSEKRQLFQMAIQAYTSYQWFHGPRNFGKYLYYSFQVGGFPFFVVDGRTQRLRDDEDYDLTDNYLLGRPGKGTGYQGQIDNLVDWLIEQQKTRGDRPKFIVTASVFAPNEVRTTRNDREKAQDDAWAAFPNTRRHLLQAITDNHIQNVVFLSGDIHCSNVAAINFYDKQNGKDSPIRAYSITSSAFYWPYPFADGNPLDYVHNSSKENDDFDIGNGWMMRYQAWSFEQDDNYTQVDLDWKQRSMRIRTFNRDGNPTKNSETVPL
ncbi:alkaline phosphatase D family protein [Ferriphaselus sp. R-1]|uniref:alkaline phosphatase D family protein n=1 Tax=Ferriphaselus sp. R-1 TaxID=1485544 RepID=UPI0006900D71|nr:alkaline phosphatase D family protein [Ferriphaselus sp. R-1]